MQKKLPYKKGIHLEATPLQWFMVFVTFLIFFVVPVGASEFYFKPQENNTNQENYNAANINTTEADVAGAFDSRYIELPFNIQVEKDLSNPASVLMIVGVIFGTVSLLLFGKIIKDMLMA